MEDAGEETADPFNSFIAAAAAKKKGEGKVQPPTKAQQRQRAKKKKRATYVSKLGQQMGQDPLLMVGQTGPGLQQPTEGGGSSEPGTAAGAAPQQPAQSAGANGHQADKTNSGAAVPAAAAQVWI